MLKTLRYLEETSDVETGEVMVFVGDRFVVTVRRGEGNPLRDVRHRLELNRDQLALGPAAVLHAVMDSVVDNYVLIERALSDDLDHIEQQVFTGAKETDVTAIYRLKREVLEFRRAAYPLAEALGPRGRAPVPGPDRRRRCCRSSATWPTTWPGSTTTSSPTTGCSPTSSTPTSPRSPSSRTRTCGASRPGWPLSAVPTMVAGIYGMNFEFMPELSASVTIGDTEFHWGYFAILAVILASTTALFLFFRRHHWL